MDLTQLGRALHATFLELGPDAAQRDFISRSSSRPHSRFRTLTQRVVRTFVSDYDANALLSMYPMHLLSTDQWRSLLQLKRPGTLLDVGAGDGGLTEQLCPLFTSITTTETSRHMARRLRARGFECFEGDLAESQLERTFDCVVCLNVVDRTPKPRALLEALAKATEPTGLLVVATPLPVRAFYYRGPQTLEPKELLHAPGPTWERAVMQFVDNVEAVIPGMALRQWTRAPYLSWGDSAHELYVLDDFIGVWSPVGSA